MPEIVRPYKIGNYWTNLVDSSTGKSVNFEEVTTWWDGTPMDDSKADGVVYRKLPASVGGGYVRRVVVDNLLSVLEFVNLTDSDHTVGVQNAIDICSRYSINLLLPKITLNLSGTLTISAPLSIVGQNSVIRSIYNDTLLIPMIVVSSNNVSIDGLTLDGETNYNRGIHVDNSNNVSIYNVNISNLRGIGIYVNESSMVTMSGANIDSVMLSDTPGQSGDGATGAIRIFNSNHIAISNTNIVNAWGKGIATQASYEITADNVSVADCKTDDGPSFYTGHNSEHVSFRNCSSSGSVAQAIKISRNSSHIEVINCTLSCGAESTSGPAVLFVQGGNNCVISGNKIESYSTKWGVRLEPHADPQGGNCFNNKIINNTIYSEGGGGIRLFNSLSPENDYRCEDNTVSSNTIVLGAAGDGIFADDPSGTLITNNHVSSDTGGSRGIFLNSVSNSTAVKKNLINGNFISGTLTYGIWASAHNSEYCSNTIMSENITNSSIRVGVVTSNRLMFNLIKNVSVIGIEVIGSTNSQDVGVDFNSIYLSSQSATGVSFSARSGTVTNNRVYGAGTSVVAPFRTNDLIVHGNGESSNALENATGRIIQPVMAARYFPSGSSTAIIAIKLPKAITAAADEKHITIEASVNNRGASAAANNNSFKIRVSGRILSSGPSWFASVASVFDSSTTPAPLVVRMAFEQGFPVILLGELPGLSLQAVNVSLDNIIITGGNDQFEIYETGYDISLVNSLDAYVVSQTITAKNSLLPASVSSAGLVLQSAASPDTAVAAPVSYDQAQVQSIVDELRDLKTKMRAAGILAT